MPKPRVSIIRIEEGDVTKAAQEAVKLAGGLDQIVSQGDTVLIKPNAKNMTQQGLGVNTDLRVIESLLDLVQEQRPDRILIAEGAAYPSGNWDTMAAFKVAGITEMARRKKAELCDLNTTEPATVDIPNGLTLKTFTTGRIVLDVDAIINVPVMKTHTETLASICLKNLAVGIARKWEKKVLHRAGIHKSIVDVYANIETHFNVVDGVVGLEGDGPNVPKGKPKPLGIILAGEDGLAVDAVGCTIMGIDPWEVAHLRLAAERGLGTIELDEIKVLGEPIEKITNPFKKPVLKNP
ncbi:MAG: DUF362 domain-containing protein [Candidatus Bathyarchaeota archaeon]|nr:MAG: DUF362 domain-containing protein [Candidatus Bathyarchaeota archaeon]